MWVSVQIFPLLEINYRPLLHIPMSNLSNHFHRPHPPNSCPSLLPPNRCLSIPSSTMVPPLCRQSLPLRCFPPSPTLQLPTKLGQHQHSNLPQHLLQRAPDSILWWSPQLKQGPFHRPLAPRPALHTQTICFPLMPMQHNNSLLVVFNLISLLKAVVISCLRLNLPVRLFRLSFPSPASFPCPLLLCPSKSKEYQLIVVLDRSVLDSCIEII